MNFWNKAEIPRKGWECCGVTDLGFGEYKNCMMCGNEKVRYVHLMSHQDCDDVLEVGCVCAEKMSDDYVNPKERVKKLKSKEAKRKRLVNKVWRVSAKGNEYLNVNGFNIGYFGKCPRIRCFIDGEILDEVFETGYEARVFLANRVI